MSNIQFGVDSLLREPRERGVRIGLVTNHAARTASDPNCPSRVAMLTAGFQVVRLFSPEHGLSATADDGTAVPDGIDPLTHLPVVSLYGERMRPLNAALSDLNTVVFDVPDIGARFYTYIWTLWHMLEACAEAGLQLVVLDRPNPLGGDLAMAEGPMLDLSRHTSFLGRANIPIRHCLTVGELAQVWNAERSLNVRLRVIPCSGWKRAQHWPETGRPFIPTSPAITSYESVLIYPGLCLFEATNLSVGRGTTKAFQMVGAPWLRATELATRFNNLRLPGVSAMAEEFTPTQPPWSGQQCSSVRLRVTNPKCFHPVLTGLHLLATVIAVHPHQFQCANYPTVANPDGSNHFEHLVGQSGLRDILEQSSPEMNGRLEEWTATPGWAERVRGHLLYD